MNDADLLASMTTYYIAGAFMMFFMIVILNHFHRRPYLLTWALSWAGLLAGYLMLYYGYVFEMDVLFWFYGLFILLGVFLQQRGAYMFLDRAYPKNRLILFSGMLLGYIVLSGALPGSDWPILVLFIFAGVLYLDAGRLFLKGEHRPYKAYGVILAIYAPLIALFPHMDSVLTQTGILQTLFLIFGMAVAYGMVAMHLFNVHLKEQAMQEKLYYLSFHDHLTGLRNRVYLESFLNTLDENTEVNAAILMADLDTLKVINDRYGHASGDAMILRAGEIIEETTGKTDLLVRYGGDEFVAVYAGKDEADMEKVKRHLRKRTKEETVEGVSLSFSIGVSVHENGRSVYDTLRIAEKRMYEDKRTKMTHR